MNIKTNLVLPVLFLLVIFFCESKAQTLTPSVIASGGTTSVAAGVILTSTIGEPCYTTLQGAGSLLTQGEQQPFLYLKILHLKAFIQGFYLAGSGGQMTPVLYNTDPVNHTIDECDSVTVELHQSDSPYALVATSNSILHTDGNASFVFNNVSMNKSYYIVLKHRNSIETWSKNPLMMNDINMRFEF